MLPLVLCPTTSGTGSEVSGAAVLTDTARDRKVGIANGLMRAQHALVDPLLTLGLPPGPTAHSGVDALAQAIAACTVRDGNPLSVAFGLEAVHHISQSLERAVKDGSDRDARRQLACGSLTGGLSMNLSDCAADHALGQAIGSLLHLPHGLTIGIVLAETLDRSRVDCAARLERVADALGEPDDGSGDGSRAVRARAAPARRRQLPDGGGGGRARGARRAADRADADRAGVLLRLRLPRLDARRGRRRLPRGARPGRAVTEVHDNHNHLVANGDALAMVRAAEAAGLASFAFTEHIFHLEEARAASRYLGTRWDGELEGPPIGVDRYLREIRAAGEAVPAVAVRAGLELEHWPDDPRVREVQDAFVASRADDWDIVIGSVHCLTGDHSIFDPSIPLGSDEAWDDYLARIGDAVEHGGFDVVTHPVRLAVSRPEPPADLARAARPAGGAGRGERRRARGQRLGHARLPRARRSCCARRSPARARS